MLNDVCIRDLAEAIGGRVRFGSMPPLGGDLEPLGRIVASANEVATGDVLWMLDDANDPTSWAEEAYSRGALGVVAPRHVEPWAGKFSIEVENTTWAMWQFTRWVRDRFTGHVVAVAGGFECRTAQALIGRVLEHKFAGASRRNARQDLTGLMLNLFYAQSSDDFHVAEVGANDFAEIDGETHLCQPNIAVITGVTHVFRPDDDAVVELESRCSAMLSALPDDGWAILDGDVPWLRRAAQNTKAKVRWIGRGSDCDVVASNVKNGDGALSFTIDGHSLRVPSLARHQLNSVLAAYAVARAMDVPASEICDVFGSVESSCGEGGQTPVGSCNVINDPSRSNLLVSCAGFERLREANSAGQRIAVCTRLPKNLAQSPLAQHIAEAVVTTAGADSLVVVGESATSVAAAATDAGMPQHCVLVCAEAAEAAAVVQSQTCEEDTLLVHGNEAENQQFINRLRDLTVAQQKGETATPGPVFLPAGDNLSEVLPLGSTLREVDATLPPG